MRRIEEGELVVPGVEAAGEPPTTEDLRESIEARLPRLDITSLLIETDAQVGFTGCFRSRATSRTRAATSRRLRSTCATSTPQSWRRARALSLADMAQRSGLSYARLCWTTRWYVREDALSAATGDLVDFQHAQPLAKIWGGGTLSSSDGQRFPVSGKVLWRQGSTALLRLRARHHVLYVDILHVDLGSVLAIRHKGNLHDRTGRDLRARRDPRQRNGADSPRAHHLSPTATPISSSVFSIFSACGSLRYLESEAYRRRIGRKLNKGDQLHQLRNWLMFDGDGKVRRKQEAQTCQAGCLNLMTNAVVAWNTLYMQEAIRQIDPEREFAEALGGEAFEEERLEYLFPARFDHVNRYGKYRFDTEEESRRTGLRPLREV